MKSIRAVLDTNVIISALIFGGQPRRTLKEVITGGMIACHSPLLLAELVDVLYKKFHFTKDKLRLLEKKIKKHFILVYPQKNINILKDTADNRVLETALAGKCDYIITGDKELLALKKYQQIKIITVKKLISSM